MDASKMPTAELSRAQWETVATVSADFRRALGQRMVAGGFQRCPQAETMMALAFCAAILGFDKEIRGFARTVMNGLTAADEVAKPDAGES